MKNKTPDHLKISLIFFIEKIYPHFEDSKIYRMELKAMRARYIYKDISKAEFLKDVAYLKNLKDILIIRKKFVYS